MDKSNDKSLEFDAYFIDEFGLINDSTNVNEPERIGLHKNIFTGLIKSGTAIIEEGQSGKIELPNMADPVSNPMLKGKSTYTRNPIEKHGLKHTFHYYFGKEVQDYFETLKKNKAAKWDSKQVIHLSLLFAVGTELNRHGLRTFFKNTTELTGVIVIPGIEPGFYNNKGRWGIAISDSKIKDLLNNYFQQDVPYEINIIAAYSTGINGINQAVLNDIIDLKHIKRVIFYDCLSAQFESGFAEKTIKKLKKNNPKIHVIIYWTSIEGNTITPDKNHLIVVQNLRPTVSTFENVIKLQGLKWYRCLICSRIIQAGIQENLLNLSSQAKDNFLELEATLPPRGSMISDEAIFKRFQGSTLASNKTVLENWYNKNKAIVEKFYRFLDNSSGNFPPIIKQIWNNAMLGYYGNVAEEVHDLLLPEFGWEYLPYS
ncbi:hypothetical protein [Larkinella terrae]|uniref:Uncharacterized protein n=1 Tax=Larkinella terrae TaxID=2025311 RepID=A0A7K0ENA1_9BACT|nr:hypothetical protein [Larkinella terrae]MRS63323.1 hypothetical protein [Larkinella terrae]